MPPRMLNPSLVVPDALQPLLDLSKAIGKVGLPRQTLDLVRLCVCQINGRPIERTNETDERLLTDVATWQTAKSFSDAERAALALADVVTRLSDRDDPVPDDVWVEATRHYNEQELGALVMQIGLVNLWNRVNVSTKELPGAVRT